MATPGTVTDRARRLSGLVDAAVLLPAPDRGRWLDRACAGDPVMRREAETLLAHHAELAALGAERRDRLGELFHAVLRLPPDHRDAYLDVACADDDEMRREVRSLVAHATDGDFLEQDHSPLTDGETALARLHIRDQLESPASPGSPERDGRPGGGARAEEAMTVGDGDPLVGQRLGVCLVQARLGEGGMGVVYRALQTSLHRVVALKVLKPEFTRNQEWRKRLIAEAQIAAGLSHPNIATVHWLDAESDPLYIVTEFIDGPTLRDVVSLGRLEYQRLVRVFRDVARGLAAAHELGIVHRDLKPENIMLTAEDVPKIVDFGLAKSTRAIIASSTRVITGPGLHAGTPAYMAPEQLEDGAPIDFRADVFAFGVTLYEAATGIHPFAGRSLSTTFDNIKKARPAPITRPGLDLEPLDGIVQRCLEKDPARRYQSTRDLVTDLEGLAFGSRKDVSTPDPRPVQIAIPIPAWWQVHQLATCAFYTGAVTFLWLVQGLARPLWAGRTLALLGGVAPGVVLVGMRLHLWFLAHNELPALRGTRRRYRPWLLAADVTLTLAFAVMAALMLAVDRPGTAAPFLILALVNLILFLAVEPATEHDAFGDGGNGQNNKSGRDDKDKDDDQGTSSDQAKKGSRPSR